MSKFDFVSHQDFPEDQYITEVVYLSFDGKYRIAYVRKRSSNGGMFWTPATITIRNNGKKEYLPVFLQDSNFLEKEIKTYLENREWEKEKTIVKPEAKVKDELPF